MADDSDSPYLPSTSSVSSFETIDELCYGEKSDFYPNSDANINEGKEQILHMPSKSACERSSFEFPPPITTIGSNGKPRVYFKSFRKDGRFVLKEIRIPTQRCLQSKREDGRLTMQVLRPRDEELEMMKGDKEDK